MSILSHPLTYTDLEREREARDERLELIEGEIVVTPSPSPLHKVIQHRLAVCLDEVVVKLGLGIVMSAPLDVFFGAHTVLQPALIVLLRDRRPSFGSKGIEGAPSLTIEIFSPSTGLRDRGQKRHLYARYGVPEYWLVHTVNRTVTIFSQLENGHYTNDDTANNTAVSATIPGLSIDLSELFSPVWDDE
jgi:Uma2 family endonuclease